MILVTGGAGYIGAVTVRRLLAAGMQVRVVDKCLYGDASLAEIAEKIDLIQGDLCDFDPMWLDGVTAVIHLAGLSNDPTAEYNPEANHRLNTLATATLADTCKHHAIQRFVFASSCSIYDQGLGAAPDLQDEDAPVAPQAAYASSKYAAERALLELVGDDFQPVILRQGTVYGWSPRMRYDLVVNTFVKCAFETSRFTLHAGGVMWRPLVDVEDVADCYLACLKAPLADIRGQIVNLAHANYRVIDLAEEVRDALADQFAITIEAGVATQTLRDYRVDTQKLSRLLDFRPARGPGMAAAKMAEKINQGIHADFHNPRYYNIKWLETLVEMQAQLKRLGSIF